MGDLWAHDRVPLSPRQRGLHAPPTRTGLAGGSAHTLHVTTGWRLLGTRVLAPVRGIDG